VEAGGGSVTSDFTEALKKHGKRIPGVLKRYSVLFCIYFTGYSAIARSVKENCVFFVMFAAGAVCSIIIYGAVVVIENVIGRKHEASDD
jgi:hypothetical protein